MALEENKEIEKEVVQQEAVTEEPTYNGLTLSQLQNIFPEIETLPSELTQEESEFWYGFDAEPNLVSNACLYIESKIPTLGTLFSDKSPDELYGEGYSNLSPDKKRQVLLTYRRQQLERDYPILSQTPRDEESFTTNVGRVFGVLADPTTAIPLTQSLKLATVIGTGIGIGYSATEDLALKGKVDAKKALQTGAIAGGATYGLGKAFQVMGKKLQAKQEKKATANEMKDSNAKIDEIDYVIAKAVANDVPTTGHAKLINDELGYTSDDLIDIISKTDRRPSYRMNKEQAQGLLTTASKGVDDSARTSSGMLDNIFGVISTRIGNISKPIKQALRNFEFKVSTHNHNSIVEFKPLMKAIQKVPNNIQPTLSVHLANGNYKAAEDILSRFSPDAKQAIDKARTRFKDTYDELTRLGYKQDYIDNYFPRVVKDSKGLQKLFNKQEQGIFSKAAEVRKKELGVNELPQAEKDKIINKIIRGESFKKDATGKESWAQPRQIKEITEDMTQFYVNPIETLRSYSASTASDIEKRRFFLGARDLDKSGNLKIDDSIGSYISKEIDKGKMSAADEEELTKLLGARFGKAESAPHELLRKVRDFGYMSTLANPISALTQIGDIGLSAYTQGLRNTISALFGKKAVDMRDFGMDNIIAAEISTAVDASNLLHKTLTLGGFRAVDRLGKNVLLNAALKNGYKLAKTKAGQQKLAKRYEKGFGSAEFKQLIESLKKGDVDERVKMYLFSELSDVQPISLSELPAVYLNIPNARILYMLKSYSIKQLDLIRNRIVNEFKNGSKKEAAKQLAGYLAAISMIGGTVDETKDFVLGRGFDPTDIPSNGAEQVFKLVGLNKYVRETQSTPSEFLSNNLMPPLNALDALWTDTEKLVTSGDVLPEKIIKELPVGGKIWYNFFGGGLENFEKYNKDD